MKSGGVGRLGAGRASVPLMALRRKSKPPIGAIAARYRKGTSRHRRAADRRRNPRGDRQPRPPAATCSAGAAGTAAAATSAGISAAGTGRLK
jgi:hypothetical protein